MYMLSSDKCIREIPRAPLRRPQCAACARRPRARALSVLRGGSKRDSIYMVYQENF